MAEKKVTRSSVQDTLAGGAAALLGRFPHGLVLGLGAVAGRLGGLIAGRKNGRTRANLERAGAADPAGATRAAWRDLGGSFAEMLWMTGQDPARVASELDITGLELFREARDRGQGTLLVSSHSANWELASLAASRSGVPMGVIARTMRTPGIERRITAFRERGGIRTLVRGRPGASVAAVRLLKQGGILGCMMDRLSSGQRILVPFLGQATEMPSGPIDLAARTGAQVVAGCARREASGRTRVEFRRVPAAAGATREELALEIARALEAEVAAAPQQWLWIYRRQQRWTGTPVAIADDAPDSAPAAAE
jgi:KDO2-lipid IV(A) lauroyltransferase